MALKIPHIVPQEIKHERSRRLLELSEEKRTAFYSRHIGHEAKVLLEHTRRAKIMHGFTDNYIRIELPAMKGLDNTIAKVSLLDFNEDRTALKAELTGQTR